MRKQRRIRIESKTGEKGGSFTFVSDADTGERVPGLAGIIIRLGTDNIVIAEVSYRGGETQRRYIGKIEAIISGEVVENGH